VQTRPVTVDRQQIVTEAVALLDAEGLEGVTLRKLAARLGIAQPTLYWHLPNKAALVTAIADAILTQGLTELAPPGPGQPWPDWLASLAGQLRRTLLAHPDGARLVASSQASRTMAALSELAISTLTTYGVPLRQARLIVFTVERFTMGHVLEEQSPRPDPHDVDLASFTQQFPNLVASITDYFQPGRTVDDLFHDCLEIVIRGAAATAVQQPVS
jgi:TetR/AcrR family transcriptional regulator, tetracycline repressor protein